MSFALSKESVPAIRAESQIEAHAQEPRVSAGIPRWADAGIALAGLIVLSPLIVGAGLAIAVTSGLPILFRQKRIGRAGQTFILVKLRTMKPSVGGPQITRKGDQRVTRLGNVLRKTKVDELPTLWNILRGDMSLVGPRPEVPRYVQLDDPAWQTILKVRPGLTDPVTLRLRNEEAMLAEIGGDLETYYVKELQPSKVKGYLDYLQRRTLGGDIRLLFQTLAGVLLNRR
jgi:lipopolysaccharide/colanic/teichoic acid biosynthesis glycosyltransferase